MLGAHFIDGKDLLYKIIFQGAEFLITDGRTGIFNLFTNRHFPNFFYMSLLFGTGIFLAFAIISHLFDRKFNLLNFLRWISIF